MKTIYVAKKARSLLLVTCVFAPFLVLAFALYAIPDKHVLGNFGGQDWIWLILLAAMMLGLYYFLAIYVKEKGEATAQFQRLDRDRDGYISLKDAGNWADLRRLFDKFDVDHDGRMSHADFEAFQNSLYSH
jgi:uncharacterized membrane protein YcjF (UPF0283 family)